MFQLRCTVRNCHHLLHRGDGGLTCDAGHHFDQAKQGYWNLLQPQDRRSKNPGDADVAVLARQRWLARGHAAGLIDAVARWTAATDSQRILELGCGEGSIGAALFAGEAAGYCGIDLSKRAIRLAARLWPSATWVMANADRVLPAADQSVDLVMSLFGRRPATEIARVLVPEGRCVIAVPGADDLIELRREVQQTADRRSRWEAVVSVMTTAGLTFVQHQLWQHQVDLESDAIADALAMTYRGARHSQQTRAQSLTAMRVTLAADLILLRR